MSHNQFRIAFTLIMLTLLAITLLNADKIDSKPAPEPQPQPIKVTATAFCQYGQDETGIDFGPGYCIISDQSEIPLYSLLDIDIYGECQAVAKSDKLAKDEVKLWYNAPSKVPMFGTQTAYVRIIGEGDKPCRLNE
jgi:3D (Asp-Asp-Asp) domain-containing protein